MSGGVVRLPSKVLFLCLISLSLFGAEVKYCAIVDASKHASNQALLKGIVAEELANKALEDRARYLMSRIASIAEKLMKRGFAVDAYGIPRMNKNSIAAFDCFALWEGEQNASIPLTFFVYVWPSEEFALQYNANSHFYRTNIHSHPIACAFVVLEGALIERNYELVSGRKVRMINEEKFERYKGSIDDLGAPFIHQLYSQGGGSIPALSLHAYGLASEAKVMGSFRETRSSHSYAE